MEQGVQTALNGVKMEIEDATYPLVKGTVTTGDAKVRAFPPLLIGFIPRFCPAAFLLRHQGCIPRRLCLCSRVRLNARAGKAEPAHTHKEKCQMAHTQGEGLDAARQGRRTAPHPACANVCGEVLRSVALVVSTSE